MIEKINSIINDPTYQKDLVYLISSINYDNGFLLTDNSIWFISRNHVNLPSRKTKTNTLNLITNVFIKAQSISSTYKDDYYNIIELSDYQQKEKLQIFVDLCCLFVNMNNMNIEDFFDSLIEMFKNRTSDEKFNIIGLFGELYFIKYFFTKFNINLSHYWHVVNTTDRHDFSLSAIAVEVKTTLNPELVFLINHKQLFSSMKTIVALLRIYNLPNGSSVDDLIEYFRTNLEFSQSIRFQIALNTELLKIKNHDDLNIKFEVEDVNFYLNEQLESIEEIPLHISKIHYNYDFSSQNNLNEIDLCNLVRSGLGK